MSAVTQPSGTVTLVFTDIEGSTRLLEELGVDAYREALSVHRDVVRVACGRHDGYEVDYEGDAFFYAFQSAQAAVSAVAEAMVGLQLGLIRIRVGIHTGEPALDPPKYVGIDVHRAARIMSSAHGGQVVLSPSTVALLEPGSFDLKELGAHRLKDLSAPIDLQQLRLGGLPDEFPPLKTLYRSNLPVPATPFLGREQELATVVGLLTSPDTRLLTLTGPGGTGKTRLSLQAAAAAADHFPGGVTWVPLAPLRDPGLVLSTVAQALNVRQQPGASISDALAAGLAGRRPLLVLDNLEHLLPEALGAVATVAAACEVGTVLVTSRERLQLQAETSWPVPPLSASDGERLFVERARAAGVLLDADATVGELCRRLDELPLALELAAARTVVFTPEQLLNRVGQRLDLLRGARDADPRQQTLRATIEWSYELLNPEEQRAYRAFSVFAGGCTLEGAEHVAGADPDMVQALLDKSLLRRRDTYHSPRYWMLETIREHAASQLADHQESEAAADRHADWMLTLLELAEPRDDVVFDTPFHEALADEIDNLRIAIPRMLDRYPGRTAAAAAVAGTVWAAADEIQEGIQVVRSIVAAMDDPPARTVAAGEAVLGWLTCLVGDIEASQEHTRHAIEIDEEAVSGHWLCLALGARAMASLRVEGADPVAWAERAHHLAEERKQPFEIALSLVTLGYVAGVRGDHESSRDFYERAAALASDRGYTSLEANAISNLGAIALNQERFADAETLNARVLDSSFPDPAHGGKAVACRGFAEALAGRRANRETAMLIAAADREITRSGLLEDPTETRLRAEALERIEASIGTEALTQALAAGNDLPISEAIKLASSLAQ